MGDQIQVLHSAHAIAARLDTLAGEIARGMGPEPAIVALLRGSFVFAADLMRALHAHGVRPQVDFMTLSSYGSGTTGREVRLIHDVTLPLAGKDVLLIDDILESGKTLAFARDRLLEKGASSVRLAVLLEKPGKRKVAIGADFVGFTVPDLFVVGYGLDYANRYRELPFIGTMEPPEQAAQE